MAGGTIADLSDGPSMRLLRLGMIDYVDDLVAASDLIITKSGGLIVSEVLARGAPMALLTKGTVREARGLTSSTYTRSPLTAYCAFIRPMTLNSRAIALVYSRIVWMTPADRVCGGRTIAASPE